LYYVIDPEPLISLYYVINPEPLISLYILISGSGSIT
jgi:hypothetical protein